MGSTKTKKITSFPKLKTVILLIAELKGKKSLKKKKENKYTSECNDSPRVYGHHKKIFSSI